MPQKHGSVSAFLCFRGIKESESILCYNSLQVQPDYFTRIIFLEDAKPPEVIR